MPRDAQMSLNLNDLNYEKRKKKESCCSSFEIQTLHMSEHAPQVETNPLLLSHAKQQRDINLRDQLPREILAKSKDNSINRYDIMKFQNGN